MLLCWWLFTSCSLPVHFLLALDMKQTDLPVKHRLLKSTDWLWAVSGWWSSSGVPATHWSGDLPPPPHPFCWRSWWPWGLGRRVLLVTRGAALSRCVSAAPSHSSVCRHNSTTVCCRFPPLICWGTWAACTPPTSPDHIPRPPRVCPPPTEKIPAEPGRNRIRPMGRTEQPACVVTWF